MKAFRKIEEESIEIILIAGLGSCCKVVMDFNRKPTVANTLHAILRPSLLTNLLTNQKVDVHKHPLTMSRPTCLLGIVTLGTTLYLLYNGALQLQMYMEMRVQ